MAAKYASVRCGAKDRFERAVSRYFFDLQGCASDGWYNEGQDCFDKAEIERRARELLTDAAAKQGDRAVPISLSVIEDGQLMVLTATIDTSGDIRLAWKSR